MVRGILKPVIERLHVDVDETRYGDSRDFTACLRLAQAGRAPRDLA